MFLSLLHVNTTNRPGRQWLGNVYRVHQRLWMAFPDGKKREDDEFFLGPWSGPPISDPKPPRGTAGFLFRIERDGPARILVQSERRPDWEYALQNAPHLLSCPPKLLQFNPAPQRDQAYRFRLLAHVVRARSVAREDRAPRTTRAGLTIARRKRVEMPLHPSPVPQSLPNDPDQRRQLLSGRWDPWRQWLDQIGGQRGFRPADGEGAPLLMQQVHTTVRKPEWDQPKRYNGGLFEGVLVCTDSDRLRAAIVNGIGHAKAFGFGLLSIAPTGR